MGIKYIFAIFALASVALVTAQLPFNSFDSVTLLPNQWMYFSYDVQGLRDGDMLIADVTDRTSTDVQLFAQFNRNPTADDNWNFNFYQNINSAAFERIFAVILSGEVSTPTDASTIVFGLYNNNATVSAAVNYHFYSKTLIDVVVGESRVVHLDEGQYQFFRYTIDPMFTTGEYLLRIENVAVHADIISFRGRNQFPIGIPSIGFTYGVPAVDEPGLSYIGLSSDLQAGIEYAGVANLDPPGDLEDESSDVTISFNFAQYYTINPSTEVMFQETYDMHPGSWLYLNVPVAGSNNVLVLEAITVGPLMLPLIRNGGFPSATFHDGWRQRTILREMDEADEPFYRFKAVSEPVTTANTIVGFLNTDTIDIKAYIAAHYALVREVRLGDSFTDENLNRTGMWRFYRFQSAESDPAALLSIVLTPSFGHSDIYYFIGGFPTTEQNLPWLTTVTTDGSSARTLTIPLTLNTVYHIGVLATDELTGSTFSVSFNRATRPDVPSTDNTANNNVSTALIIVVIILGCTTAVGIIAVIILAVQRKKEKEMIASGEGPNYTRLADQN